MKKMKNKKTIYSSLVIFPIFLFFILTSLLFHCSGKSEEDLIRDTIDKIGDYAENRNTNGLLSYIADEYSDEEERTIEDIEELLEQYLSRYRGIAVNVLATNIISLSVPDAEIETEVSLSSGAAQIFRKAVRYTGEFYRFSLQLVKEDETWKLKSASWKNIPLDELFPESFKLLKKLFPDSF
jgi:hypothetical protein